jgi:DNA-binding NarL/FixJ family response regulator
LIRINWADAGLRIRMPIVSSRRTDPDDKRRLATLSPRERQVLSWLARGKPVKNIGLVLEISPRTVHLHAAAIVRRLGVENRLQAVVLAIRAGMLERADAAD